MKKHTGLGILVAVLLGFGVCYPATAGLFAELKKLGGQAEAAAKVPHIMLYATETGHKVIAKLSPDQRFIRILQRGDWLKVATPEDGKVGWINRQQYQQAKRAFYRAQVQTESIQVTETQAKSGEPVQVNVYLNGKKLKDEEADAFYKRMLKNQQDTEKHWQWLSEQMRHLETHFWREFQNSVQSLAPPLFDPAT